MLNLHDLTKAVYNLGWKICTRVATKCGLEDTALVRKIEQTALTRSQ